ncbi:hypothetical protein COT98_03535 [Candidatus Falkowbacteria bacterium CG10_big_fil_rev_8_21_14_0_10_39_9]|uniref:DUF948 domain-containing protein n=1 Tax=Candidatus Falkowbacteria bacterium CG10_big_fil_rev_8_21_14_0_10_39_9 TaxID=1974566 RepID=A0A2M6WNS8_9BACT|nr:MAG: hypothetical protein COT98_03535 [Candidatus Falkowbacteria bacterium CG10_big_fil_rev_8_21_14_0_10_39_9]
MFNASRDILNLVLSISIAGLSVFICWSLFYLIASLRSVYKVLKEVEATLQKVGDLTRFIRDKVESGATVFNNLSEKANDLTQTIKDKLNNTGSYFMIISEVLKRIFDFMQEKKETRVVKKTTKK